MHIKDLKEMAEIEGRISERNFPSLEFLGPTIWQLRDKPYYQSILPPDISEPHPHPPRSFYCGSVLPLISL